MDEGGGCISYSMMIAKKQDYFSIDIANSENMTKIYCEVFNNLMNKSKGHLQKEMEPF